MECHLTRFGKKEEIVQIVMSNLSLPFIFLNCLRVTSVTEHKTLVFSSFFPDTGVSSEYVQGTVHMTINHTGMRETVHLPELFL
jgi:hypothetical protein